MIKDTQYERVRYLLEKVPATRSNDLLLILMYWKFFDNIPISNETIRAILDRGALPDSITRYKRDVIKVEKELKRLKEMTG